MSKNKRRNFKRKNGADSKSVSGLFSWIQIRNFYLPILLIVFMIACASAIVVFGYRKATSSQFFEVAKITFVGLNRLSREEVEKVVIAKTARNTVWNANLEEIRAEIQKFPYVKSAAVSRALPDGIVVTVDERIPLAPISLQSGDFWVDEEAHILGKVLPSETRPALFIRGWDESRTERAQKENVQRVKMYQVIRDEFTKFGIAKRVTDLNLSDMQDVQISTLDSDATVQIMLGREDFGKRLDRALKVIEGKGQKIQRLVSHGMNISAQYREGV